MESEEERRRKLEAGRAKLAHFRQRKAKNDSSHSQKKTQKRKTSVNSQDFPTQERAIDSVSNVRLQNSVSFESTDFKQGEGSSHPSQPFVKTEEVCPALDVRHHGHSLSINAEVSDADVNSSFQEHTFSEDLQLSDSEMDSSYPNRSFSENAELTEGELDVSSQNYTLTENIDCAVPDTHVDFQNQTFDTNVDLTDPDMVSGTLMINLELPNMLAEIKTTTQSSKEEKKAEEPIPNMVTSELDTSLNNLKETELDHRLLGRSDLENHSGEQKEDSKEWLFQEAGCHVGEEILALYSQHQQDLLDLSTDLEDHVEVDVTQQTALHKKHLHGYLAAMPCHNGDDWSEEHLQQPGNEEEESVLEQHAAQVTFQELEYAVHERNSIISRLSSNLQQALQSRDDIQGEAMLLVTQFQALQQRMKEANELLNSKNPHKSGLSKSQQQIAVFQSNLREQTTRLQMLGVKAHELEQQLEFSEKSTKDKDALLNKVEETLKGTEKSVHQLNKDMVVKEQTINNLHDELARSNQNAYVLQQALSLSEQEVMDLRNEIASVKQDHVSSTCNDQLNHSVLCRGDREMFSMREALDAELDVKYKDLKATGKLCAICSDRNIEGLNIIITDLNHKLEETESLCDNLHQALEHQMQEFSKERSATEQQHNSLLDDLKLQLKHAKEQAEQVLMLNHEKESLHSEVQELQAVLRLQFENLEMLRCRSAEETKDFALKLKDVILDKETCCDELVQSHATDLEQIKSELSVRYETQLQILRQVLARQPVLRLDTVEHGLPNLKESLNRVKSSNMQESHESINLQTEAEAMMEPFLVEDCEMAKYLVPTRMRDHSATAENSLELFDFDQCSRDDFGFFGDVAEPSLNSTVHFDPLFSPLPIMNMLDEGAAQSMQLDPASFAVYLSRNRLPSAQLNDSSEPLDENTCLIERCLLLTKQLEEKEREVTRSSEALREAQLTCKILTEALSAAQGGLQGRDLGHKVCSLEDLEDEACSELPVISSDFQTQGANCLVLQEIIKKLQYEKEALMAQVGKQKPLLQDAKLQKGGGDSVHCEINSLVYQRSAVQSDEDQMHAGQLVISESLEQNNILDESLRKEKTAFNSQTSSEEETVVHLAKDENILEESLCSVRQRLEAAEQALNVRNLDQGRLEHDNAELRVRIKDLQKELEVAEVELNFQLHAKEMAREELRKEMIDKEREFSLREQTLAKEVEHWKVIHTDLERSMEEMRVHCEAETRRLADLQMDDIRAQRQMEVHQREHKAEMDLLVERHKQEMENLRAALTKEQQLLLDQLKSQAEGSHNAEVQHALLQAQTLHHLEMEALRLSLTNMHTAHMELSQSNLHKERETALVELREMLNGKRAQEMALLQGRHQFEVEHIREQQRKEIEALSLNHQQEIDTVKQNYELELSTQLEQNIKAKTEAFDGATEELVKDLNSQLSVAHQLEASLKMQLAERENEITRLTLESEQSIVMLENLQNKLQSEKKELHEKLHVQHTKQLEELKQEAKVVEDDLRQQIAKLLVNYEELKTQSAQEIKQLWSRLDSTRTSRQELSGRLLDPVQSLPSITKNGMSSQPRDLLFKYLRG